MYLIPINIMTQVWKCNPFLYNL